MDEESVESFDSFSIPDKPKKRKSFLPSSTLHELSSGKYKI